MSEVEGTVERSPASVLDAAYEQLAKHGPAFDGRSVTLSQVARATGMSRTNLYRRWPTSAELAQDIALFRGTPSSGWHAQVCVDDGGPLEDALRRSLTTRSSAEGVMTRASVSTWYGSSAQAGLAAWEHVHLAALAARLRREWGDAVDGQWTDVALTITALVDGMHLMWVQMAERLGDPMPEELAEEVVQTAMRITRFLVNESAGADAPLATLDDALVHDPERHAQLLPQRVIDALADGSLDPADGGRRVVDMGILSRSLGMSERSLYSRWPTPADLNAELFLESVDRTRHAYSRIVLEVFQSNVSGAFTHTMPLIARMNEVFMDQERFPEAAVHLGLIDVITGPGVLELVRDQVEVGLQHADMQTAAIVAATGFRLRPDVRMRTYTQLIVGMGMGCHRLRATHPTIRDRRLGYLGQEYSASGIGHTAMTRTSCELLDPMSDLDSPTEPPVPPVLGPTA